MLLLQIFIIIVIVSYLYSYLSKRLSKEGFSSSSDNAWKDKLTLDYPQYYGTFTTYNTIYDNFYVFLYDMMYYDENYYANLVNTFFNLELPNHPFETNLHLCIGYKNGGHVQQLLSQKSLAISASKSPSIIDRSKFNYPKQKDNFIHSPNYETNVLSFETNSFTQISIIDDEIFYIRPTKLPALIENIRDWVVHLGYIFIQCYENKLSFDKQVNKPIDNSKIHYYFDYERQVYELPSRDTIDSRSDNYYMTELLRNQKTNTQRENIHTLYYHDPRQIKRLMEMQGHFKLVDTIDLKHSNRPGRVLMVFQKKM